MDIYTSTFKEGRIKQYVQKHVLLFCDFSFLLWLLGHLEHIWTVFSFFMFKDWEINVITGKWGYGYNFCASESEKYLKY